MRDGIDDLLTLRVKRISYIVITAETHWRRDYFICSLLQRVLITLNTLNQIKTIALAKMLQGLVFLARLISVQARG